MKMYKDFKPVAIDPGDELFPNGIFELNITKMLAFITANPTQFPVESVPLYDLNDRFGDLDETTVANADLNAPIILAEIAPGRFNIIDGNHRAEKARRSGIQNILAYRVRPDVHHRFFTSERAYRAYVDYWNEKRVSGQDLEGT